MTAKFVYGRKGQGANRQDGNHLRKRYEYIKHRRMLFILCYLG
jgi:hypothetical protein